MPTPADLLAEQLWGGALRNGDVRIGVGEPPPGWQEQESYWMFPSAGRARLFLPRGPRAVTRAAAVHYRGLRRPAKNVGRWGLGLAATARLPLSGDRLGVWVRRGDGDAAARLPLALLAEALGTGPLYASFGVRSGANRKATLHLLDAAARPVGYAKLGWNPITDLFVRTEGRTLREVGGRPGPVRAPALLAQIDNHGHPVVVTEPLPLTVRGARDRTVAPPTSHEIHALAPVLRHAPARDTRHLQALVSRLQALPSDATTQAHRLLDTTLTLADTVTVRDDVLPVASRWHGDFTPWNRARDEDGRLWLWDWESSEEDAVAGLDALHWAYSVRRPASGRSTVVDLRGCLDDARHHLVAAGVPRAAHGLAAATYAVTVLERALDLATRSGGWETLWIRPPHLQALADQAGRALAEPG